MLNIIDNAAQEQAKAIREQIGQRPASPTETARQARWRAERERAEAEAKKHPHRSY